MTRILLCLLCMCIFGRPVLGQPVWKSGNQLERVVLDSPFRVSWHGAGVRQQLTMLAKNSGIGLWLDRRVDPDREVVLDVANETFEQIAYQTVFDQGMGVVLLDRLIFVGPPEIAVSLPTMLEKFKKNIANSSLSSDAQKRLSAQIKIDSKGYVQPAELLATLASTNKVAISVDAIPLDVWRDIELPPMPFAEFIALVGVGFDLWPEIESNGSIRFLPLALPNEIKMSLYVSQQNKDLFDKLKQQFPLVKFSKTSGQTILVSGTTADLVAVAKTRSEFNQPQQFASGKKRYTLQTSASRGDILASIAHQLDLKFQFENEANVELQKTIDLKVVDLPLEDLIEKVLNQTGLGWAIEEGQLNVRVQKK